MSTARDLITESYRISGIIAGAETPDNEEIVQGLNELNNIVEIMNLSHLWQYTTERVEFTLDSTKSEYTIGSGGDIDEPRPLQIKTLKVKVGNTLYPVRQYTPDSWNMRVDSTSQTGQPYRFQYLPDYPLGIIDFGGNPSENYECELVYEYKIEEYGLNDTISLPPGYYGTLQYMLASNLCAIFGQPNPQINAIKEKRLLLLKRNNVKNTELNNPTAGGGWYDYKTDRVI